MDKVEKQNDKLRFKNEQMLLHFYDIMEALQSKHSQETLMDESFNLIYQNQVISIEPTLVELAFIYEELDNAYKLEARTLIEEIIIRAELGFTPNSDSILIGLLGEIIKQKKLNDEKKEFKKKVVWLKK